MNNKSSIKVVLLTLSMTFCWDSLAAQVPLAKRKQLLVGSWNWCQSDEKLDSTGMCANSNYGRYRWYYVFTADGRFYESNSGNKSYGKWQLTNAELTLDYDDTPKLKQYPITKPITWISTSLFYIVGQEGKHGPLVFSYYRRIKLEGVEK